LGLSALEFEPATILKSRCHGISWNANVFL
jgi:hypothetical protein